MTDENMAAGASAGIDLMAMDTTSLMKTVEDAKTASIASGGNDVSDMVPFATGAQHVFDITAMIREVEAHIDLHDVGEAASIWLANARAALKSALQYVEGHFEAIEAKAKAEVAEIEAKIGEPLSAAEFSAAGAATREYEKLSGNVCDSN